MECGMEYGISFPYLTFYLNLGLNSPSSLYQPAVTKED